VAALGKNIERLRVAAGHANAAAFARSIGITPATLNDWESGRYTNLRLDSLFRVARGIPCTLEELIAGVDPQYEGLIANRTRRADTTRRNNPATMTSSVRPVEVKQGLSGTGGPDGGEAVRDRVPQPEAIDAEVQREIFSEIPTLDLLARLDETAVSIRAVAHALLPRVTTTGLGAPRPDHGRGFNGSSSRRLAWRATMKRRRDPFDHHEEPARGCTAPLCDFTTVLG
jgi:transcriptional regulator with XRE-family HTH domain